MRIWFEHLEMAPSKIHCVFTIDVLPDEMKTFEEIMSQYENENNIKEEIMKAKCELISGGVRKGA